MRTKFIIAYIILGIIIIMLLRSNYREQRRYNNTTLAFNLYKLMNVHKYLINHVLMNHGFTSDLYNKMYYNNITIIEMLRPNLQPQEISRMTELLNDTMVVLETDIKGNRTTLIGNLQTITNNIEKMIEHTAAEYDTNMLMDTTQTESTQILFGAVALFI